MNSGVPENCPVGADYVDVKVNQHYEVHSRKRKRGNSYDVGLWFWLGLVDDVVRHDTLDCCTRSARLGAHPLVECSHQYAGAPTIEWSAKRANSPGDPAAALRTWGD